MKSLFHELYSGRILPFERGRVKSADHDERHRRIDGIQGDLRERLSSEDYDKLVEMEELFLLTQGDSDEDAFGYGLSLGILLIVEALGFRDRILKE